MNDKKYNSIYGLIFNCPFKEQIETCPLKNIRSKDISSRLLFLEESTKEEVSLILKQHEKCLKEREKKLHKSA